MLSALNSPIDPPLLLCISVPSCRFSPSISKPGATRPTSKWWLWQLSQISWPEPLPALLPPCFKEVAETTEPDFPCLSRSLLCHLAVRQSSLDWFQGTEAFLPHTHWKGDSRKVTQLVHYKWPFVLGMENSGKAITLNSDNDSLFVIPSLSPPPQPLIFFF